MPQLLQDAAFILIVTICFASIVQSGRTLLTRHEARGRTIDAGAGHGQ